MVDFFNKFDKKVAMKSLFLLVIFTLLVSCGSTVAVDYDTKTDFSLYKSYDFYPEIASGLNNLDDKRIIRITDSLLHEKGYTRSKTPQFLINFFAKESLSGPKTTLGIGVGGGSGNVGMGVGSDIPLGGLIVNQLLTFDFVDSLSDSLFWQAVNNGELKEKANPEQREAYYVSVISKIIQKFPPEPK